MRGDSLKRGLVVTTPANASIIWGLLGGEERGCLAVGLRSVLHRTYRFC